MDKNINFYWKQGKRKTFAGKMAILIASGILFSSCGIHSVKFQEESKETFETTSVILEDKTQLLQEADWYQNSIQNLHQGNSITYADGYYYFRSQSEYSLCRSKGAGEEAERLTEQMPAEICVYRGLVYFINASDRQMLYCVETDGKNLTKLGDFPMQNMIIIGDRIYFLSVCDSEDSLFDPLLKEEDQYLYSVSLDGSDCRCLVADRCKEFTTDGVQLYYIQQEEKKNILYKNDWNGTKEEIVWQGEEGILDFVPYQGKFYGNIQKEGKWYFAQLKEEGEWEVLEDGSSFFISKGQVYLYDFDKILYFYLDEDKERKTIPIQIGKKQRRFGFSRGNNEEIFLVNNLLFCKCWESEEKGILWHIWEEELGEFVIFEDIVPLKQTDLVRGNSFETEMLFDKPGKANDIQYLDGELSLRESYRENEDETGSAVFSFQMPLFGSEIQGREEINRVMRGVEQLALKDREDFFQEVQEVKEAGYEDCGNWFKTYGYSNLYVGEQYISFYCYIRTYDGGIRPWEEAIPLTFN